jgi:2-amino-4-hydroxy-6-hydroxymethyldihydropteridine diphosphokinase
MKDVALSVGCNMGNCREILSAAVADLANVHEGAAALVCSSLYETEPWGQHDQAKFLNMAVLIQTQRPPLELLRVLQEIEERHGRVRHERWGPRTLDIDMLLYGSDIVDIPDLTVPHRLMHERKFVLLPLAEIARSWVHPVLHRSIGDLADSVGDTSAVTRVEHFSETHR